MEFCCSESSKLCMKSPLTQNCSLVRLTKEDDMTTDEGVSKALAVAQRKNVLLWASIPCTGGSPWQRITKRLASARIKIAAHIELFKSCGRPS